jgi:hypothetical protein
MLLVFFIAVAEVAHPQKANACKNACSGKSYCEDVAWETEYHKIPNQHQRKRPGHPSTPGGPSFHFSADSAPVITRINFGWLSKVHAVGKFEKFLVTMVLGMAVGTMMQMVFDTAALLFRQFAVKKRHQFVAVAFTDHDFK